MADVLGDRAVELRDARLIIAREYGFPTWREPVWFTEKSVRDRGERREKWRRLRPQAEALLENAIYADDTQVVDLLAEHGIVPQALWTYAACGRLDLVRACFDADGRLRPDAAPSRPDLAAIGPFPARLPAADDREEIIAEAFVHACQHGRTEVVRWFLDSR